ncbi:MAG: ribbon-helix-helix domain-containing protein [Candidatus Diapherotrites archaeon]
MEHVSIKLDAAFAKQIERDMREFNYTTKTEFIRESIRDKLKQLAAEREKKKAWEALFAVRGILKGKVPMRTREEEQQFEKKIDREIREHYEKKFGINLK